MPSSLAARPVAVAGSHDPSGASNRRTAVGGSITRPWWKSPRNRRPRIAPRAAEGVAVGAKRARVVRRRPPLPSPNRQSAPFELVDVVDGVARVGVEAALYPLARLGPERPFVTNDLDTRDPLAVLLPEIDALDKEEAALHPLVGRPFPTPLRTSPRYRPACPAPRDRGPARPAACELGRRCP